MESASHERRTHAVELRAYEDLGDWLHGVALTLQGEEEGEGRHEGQAIAGEAADAGHSERARYRPRQAHRRGGGDRGAVSPGQHQGELLSAAGLRATASLVSVKGGPFSADCCVSSPGTFRAWRRTG